MAKENHCALIPEHMKKYGSIHHFEAEKEYGCVRLAARIKDLRNRGVKIGTEIVTGKNRYGGTTRYAVYSLEGSDRSAAGGGRSDLSDVRPQAPCKERPSAARKCPWGATAQRAALSESQWQRSAGNEPASSGEVAAGHRNRRRNETG